MAEEQRLEDLSWLRDTLTEALENVNKMIDDIENKCELNAVRGNVVSLPDSFSEDKEKFIAP